MGINSGAKGLTRYARIIIEKLQ